MIDGYIQLKNLYALTHLNLSRETCFLLACLKDIAVCGVVKNGEEKNYLTRLFNGIIYFLSSC